MRFSLSHIYLILFAGLLLNSCIGDIDTTYKLPRKAKLETNFLYSPLNMSSILDHPIIHGDMWNDSLIKLCKINKIQFNCIGGETPETIGEYIINEFDEKGRFHKFEYYNVEKGKSPYSEININPTAEGRTIVLNKFFGEKENIVLKEIQSNEKNIFLRTRNEQITDSVITLKLPGYTTLIIEKIGSKISHLQVVTPKNTSIKEIQERINNYGIDDPDLLFASMSITYTVGGLPRTSYNLSIDWTQKELQEEWEYFEDRVITRYKKYVNHTLVKDYQITYTDDLVMRSIDSDGKKYELVYN